MYNDLYSNNKTDMMEKIWEKPAKLTQQSIDLLPDEFKENLSDGYHSFKELYEHRMLLYLALCRNTKFQVYKTKKNFEKKEWNGWFLLCINSPLGQISYHIENKYWDDIDCDEVEYNFKYDGHTSKDVLERLKQL